MITIIKNGVLSNSDGKITFNPTMINGKIIKYKCDSCRENAFVPYDGDGERVHSEEITEYDISEWKIEGEKCYCPNCK